MHYCCWTQLDHFQSVNLHTKKNRALKKASTPNTKVQNGKNGEYSNANNEVDREKLEYSY